MSDTDAETLYAINQILPVLPKSPNTALLALLNILVSICCEFESAKPGSGRSALDFCQDQLDEADATFERVMVLHEYNQMPKGGLQ